MRDVLGRDASAIWHPSENFGDRRGVDQPDMVVLHYTAMASAVGARDWLCNPQSQVSAHYVISEGGELWQLVNETDRAWHAGAGAWGACTDVNSRSIGVEISNTGTQPFSEPQMQCLEALLGRIMRRWSIPVHRIIGHSDLAIGRKIDPGRRFDWLRLARQGLAIWPKNASASGADTSWEQFAKDAQTFGYRWCEGQEDAVLNAVRMRFSPWLTGSLQDLDVSRLNDLARHWPDDSNDTATS